ncbi:MAG: hypothetical protein K6V97_10595 [Actinomycetia bacterium]|nr:hypothetical protein [Actinomycetes bacterium]
MARTTRVPLWGPLGLPDRSAQGEYLAVRTAATATAYEVDLQWADAPLPVNSPQLWQPPNTGLANVLGSFGGHAYPRLSAAQAALTQLMGYYWQNPPPVRLHTVVLAAGVAARVWTQSQGRVGLVRWQEDGWRCEVSQVPDLALARTLAGYIAAHPLPAASGVLAVAEAGDGEHTQLAWRRYGTVVYTAGNYHDAVAAVAMAEAMRPYAVIAASASEG